MCNFACLDTILSGLVVGFIAENICPTSSLDLFSRSLVWIDLGRGGPCAGLRAGVGGTSVIGSVGTAASDAAAMAAAKAGIVKSSSAAAGLPPRIVRDKSAADVPDIVLFDLVILIELGWFASERACYANKNKKEVVQATGTVDQ